MLAPLNIDTHQKVPMYLKKHRVQDNSKFLQEFMIYDLWFMHDGIGIIVYSMKNKFSDVSVDMSQYMLHVNSWWLVVYGKHNLNYDPVDPNKGKC